MDDLDLLLQPTHLLVLLLAYGIFILPLAIFYILALQKALNQCSPLARTLKPEMCWLLLIPLVNLIWNFFIVLGVANSLGIEFARRGTPVPGAKPGRGLGLAMCIFGALIPIVGILAALPYLILWIIYWAKIAEFSRMLS
ncbi:MAG: hypothetical protein WCE75_05290, partial [Terracidiphilus sp.]